MLKNLFDTLRLTRNLSVTEMNINLISLTFEGGLEKQFQKDYFKSSIRLLRISFILGVVYYSVFSILDWIIIPEMWGEFAIIRFLLVCPIVLLIFFLSFTKNFHRWWQRGAVIATVASGLGIVLMTISSSAFARNFYYPGIILVLIYCYTLIKLRFIWASLAGWVIVISYILSLVIYPEIDYSIRITNLFFVVSANISGMVGGYALEYYTRKDFYFRHLLQQERRRVEEANALLEEKVKEKTIELQKDINRREKVEIALRESRKKYRQLVEGLNEGIWQLDEEGVTKFVNPKISEILDYSFEEMVGKHLLDFIEGQSLPEARMLIQKNAHGGIEKKEYMFRKKHGDPIYTLVNTSSLRDERGNYSGLLLGVTDITERVHANQAVQRNLKKLRALRNIDQAISGSVDLKVTMDIALKEIQRQFEVDAVSILLYEPHLQTLEFYIGRGFLSQNWLNKSLRLGEGYAGQIAFTETPLSIDGSLNSVDGPQKNQYLPDEEFCVYYGLPLITKGKVKGVLELYHRSQLKLTRKRMEFLETLATQCAIAIDNLIMFNNLQRSNLELSLAYDSTLEGWAKALELRDQETEGHARRVVEMTLTLAKKMGIDQRELNHVRRGALLHDIGKMGIPDSILHKPGPLDEDEWELMKKHPIFAYNMLKSIEFLRPALDIPYCHHEKWDGSGYPRGLKGEKIPLAARIFALIDVWDALLSDRPYRDAWPKSKVVDYIQEQSGGHFDPKVIKAFFNSGLT